MMSSWMMLLCHENDAQKFGTGVGDGIPFGAIAVLSHGYYVVFYVAHRPQDTDHGLENRTG